MVPLLVGIVLLVLAFNLVMPYALYLVCLILGILLVVYGVFVLLAGLTGSPITRSGGRRYWY